MSHPVFANTILHRLANHHLPQGRQGHHHLHHQQQAKGHTGLIYEGSFFEYRNQ